MFTPSPITNSTQIQCLSSLIYCPLVPTFKPPPMDVLIILIRMILLILYNADNSLDEFKSQRFLFQV